MFSTPGAGEMHDAHLAALDGPDLAERLQTRLANAGASPKQAARCLRAWLGGRGLLADADRRDAPFSRALRVELAALQRELDRAARVVERHAAADGSERCVLALADGRRVEAAALPSQSACLSSQVGCAVGCGFCATGLGGLERNLTALEIAASFARLAERRPPRRALFMGMGEPAHNAAAVLAAGRLLAEQGDLGRSHVVVSTVGDPRLLDALERGPFRPALALSLHAADARVRRELLPRAPAIEPAELVRRARDYVERSGLPVQIQYALLAGRNDSDADLTALAELLRSERLLGGALAVVNLIPWNPVPELPFERPTLERCRAAVRLLMRAGVLAKLRFSAGLEADAACGQLRARRGTPAGR